MHPGFKILAAVMFVVVYAFGTYFYELKIMGIAIGWWVELIKMRPAWSSTQALWYFIWVATTTFIAVPHFAWLPVYVIKELVYLFRRYEHSKPYEARYA